MTSQVIMSPTGTTKVYTHPLVRVLDVDVNLDLGWISFFWKVAHIRNGDVLPIHP